ncbi:MAP kinase-activating death domain-containing protein [Aphelenchoides besseyi]|nr:MAP kinase-activating death domain-containing protein [Aphelenchoides besseyi]
MDDKSRELCPRLIDFLVIVGRRADSKLQKAPPIGVHVAPQDIKPLRRRSGFLGVANPEILRRYPTDNHKDFELPTDVTLFCQPEGCVTIGHTSKRPQLHNEANSFVFMLTEKDSAKVRYGITLNFFLSNECHQTTVDDTRPRKNPNASLTSLCFISHHPFLSTFRDLLILLGQLIDACNLRCNADNQLPTDAVWSVITGHWSGPIPQLVMQEIRQLETWILMILSSPIPVPGKTKLVLEVLPTEFMPMIEFALPDHTRFTLIDFPIHLPLELLDVGTVMQLLAAMMLEYKIVLQSRNYNAVSMCVMAFVALMYPLEYMFPVIPLLPSFMHSAEQLLLAPTPFIIGVPASFFLCKGIALPSDVILVDLDTNEITIPSDMDIPAFPEPEATNLREDLLGALGKCPRSNVDRPEKQTSGLNLDVDQIDVAVRIAMVRFFDSPNVFANFSEHTRTLRLYPRPVVALQAESFLRSRPVQSPFINELCKTQSVEYFAESSLCPRNEAYVRVQNGITNVTQIGDKAKWFTETLMPIHFNAYPDNSNLADAYSVLRSAMAASASEEDDEFSDLDSQLEESTTVSPFSEHAPDFEATKPLSDICDVYHAPNQLQLPSSLSHHSMESSASSGRSSPVSSNSPSANNSEADIARLAENLAIKSNEKGEFAFDRPTDSSDSTPVQSRRSFAHNFEVMNASSSTSTRPTPLKIKGFHFGDSGERMFGPQIMNTLNGYAERSHGVLSQVFSKTAPKAQAIRDKTMRPLAEAAANQMEHGQNFMQRRANQTQSKTKANNSAVTAQQQAKNQQTIREVCDQVLHGQSIGVFMMPKVKRLLEDESMRELVCQKLNLGVEVRYSEDDFIQRVQLTRAQYKGYLKILQACLAGLEHSYNSPISDGLASLFHVLEIAHTHFWAENEATTPSSGISSLLGTPSASNHNIVQSVTNIAVNGPTESTKSSEPSTKISSPETATTMHDNLQSSVVPPPLPPRTSAPPLPPRPSAISTTSNESKQADAETIQASNPTVSKVFQSVASNSQIKVENGHLKREEPVEKPKTLPVTQKTSTPSSSSNSTLEPTKHFLFQDLINVNNPLWSVMVFWEVAFLDMVAKERDIIGMDQEPSEMIDRYTGLSDSERKRLELDEDRILATLLHNITAYMIMCGTPKVRRLLGKAHIGLIYSRKINQLLDDLPATQTNAIPLRPLGSRLVQKQSFAVHIGDSVEGPMSFLEVCDDAVILRAINGSITERWWYERLVNMTYSPRTRVLCIWRRQDDKVHMHRFYTRKCRQLYGCMKKSMEQAAARGKVTIAGRNLGGEFPVHDIETSEGGLLQVRIDGIRLLFANRQDFIELSNIKKCNTYGGNMFVLEEFNHSTNEIRQRRFISTMADQICYSVLCVFSYNAAQRSKTDV